MQRKGQRDRRNDQGSITVLFNRRGISEIDPMDREAVIGDITKDIPLGIIPDDADCANAVAFLASDLASVITGAELNVNGGEFML